MKLAIGIIVAPRPKPTYKEVVSSLAGLGVAPILFCEPGCCIRRTEYLCVQRPTVETELNTFAWSKEGVFGNFGNWIQAGRDLLEITDMADTFLICEDDALFANGIYPLLERDLWPSENCGCVSLYCPNIAQYASGNGLFKAKIIRENGTFVSRSNNLVGSLALVFPRHVLEELVYHKSIDAWKGSHTQAKDKNTKSWERKAVDTWISRTLVDMGKEIWHYSPSLVLHWSPLPAGVSNSSMGHDAPRGGSSTRQCRKWIGAEPGDLLKLYPQPKERYDLHTSEV
jgi:hypothetical protein